MKPEWSGSVLGDRICKNMGAIKSQRNQHPPVGNCIQQERLFPQDDFLIQDLFSAYVFTVAWGGISVTS